MNAVLSLAFIVLLYPCSNLRAQCITPDTNGLYCHGKRHILYFNNEKAVYKILVEHKYNYIFTADEFVAADSCLLQGEHYQLMVVDRNTINLIKDHKTVFRFKLADSETVEKRIVKYRSSLASGFFVSCQRPKAPDWFQVMKKCEQLSGQLRIDVGKLPRSPLPVFFQKADSIFQYYRKLQVGL